MRPRSSWLPRPLVVACLAAALLMLSDGLPVVHATIPYYPYECPIGSGGTDFDGNGNEGFLGRPSWDPRNGLWFSSGQGADPFWGTWGDIPTPGDFNGDGIDDFAVFRPSTGTWFVTCSSAIALPGRHADGCMGHGRRYPRPGRLRRRRNHRLWRVAAEHRPWYVRSGASGATLVNGVAWGQFGDCPIAARLAESRGGPWN